MGSSGPRDVAVVLSGGGMTGVVMELGFLQRLRASELWERIGVFFGTSAGALAGCMAVLDRLDDLERFLLELRPEDTFCAQTLWRLPLRPEVELIVGFRYLPRYPVLGAGMLRSAAERMRRYSKLPAAPRLVAELEEVVADWRDRSVLELRALRHDVLDLVADRPELASKVEARFGEARFPFRHDRVIPRITVVGEANGASLDPGVRNPKPWTAEQKRELIALGRDAADRALRAHGYS